tara:strand:+ start:6933 stop:8240 length:1308 start_codon:yes stop_codon:yes gene_type:complete
MNRDEIAPQRLTRTADRDMARAVMWRETAEALQQELVIAQEALRKSQNLHFGAEKAMLDCRHHSRHAVADLEQQVKTLQTSVTRLTKQNESLEAAATRDAAALKQVHNTTLLEKTARIEALSAEVAARTVAVKTLQAENETLRKQVTYLDQVKDGAVNQAEQLDGQVKGLQGALAQGQDAHDETTAKLETLRKKYTAALAQAERFENETATLRESLAEAQEEQKQRQAAAQAENDRNRMAADAVQKELEAAHRLGRQLDGQIDGLQATLIKNQIKYEQKAAELETRTKERIFGLEAQNRKLSADLAAEKGRQSLLQATAHRSATQRAMAEARAQVIETVTLPRRDAKRKAFYESKNTACTELAASKLFDTAFYLKTYPDLASLKIDPLLHYVIYGALEGRNPSAQFNTVNYYMKFPQLIDEGQCPLLHHARKYLA